MLHLLFACPLLNVPFSTLWEIFISFILPQPPLQRIHGMLQKIAGLAKTVPKLFKNSQVVGLRIQCFQLYLTARAKDLFCTTGPALFWECSFGNGKYPLRPGTRAQTSRYSRAPQLRCIVVGIVRPSSWLIPSLNRELEMLAGQSTRINRERHGAVP